MRGKVMRVVTEEDEQFRQFEGEKRVVEVLECLVREHLANGVEIRQLRDVLLNVDTPVLWAYVAQVLQK